MFINQFLRSLLYCDPPCSKLRLKLESGSEMRITKGENDVAHRLDKWMLTVDDSINGMVDFIVNFLKGDFSVWVVPWFIRLRDPFDHGRDEIRIELLLVWWRDISDLPCVDNLLFWRMSTVSD